jgi:diadenosine tetraphosphate (Ap4A) HIT family hydrolase
MSTLACLLCQRQSLTDPFIVAQTDDWTVRHSRETNILGYLVLESRRHFLDLAESNHSECQSYGPILRAIVAAVRLAVQPVRVYTFTLAEAVPHFHVHIIPRSDSLPRAFRGRGILNYPLEPQADIALIETVCQRLRPGLRQFGSGCYDRSVSRAGN